MKLILIESPYAGDTARNIAYAKRAMLDALERGEAPMVSHLLFTQVLDDAIPEERELGIVAGLAWRRKADLRVFYTDLGWSPGMLAAKLLYELEKLPYEERAFGEDISD